MKVYDEHIMALKGILQALGRTTAYVKNAMLQVPNVTWVRVTAEDYKFETEQNLWV